MNTVKNEDQDVLPRMNIPDRFARGQADGHGEGPIEILNRS